MEGSEWAETGQMRVGQDGEGPGGMFIRDWRPCSMLQSFCQVVKVQAYSKGQVYSFE